MWVWQAEDDGNIRCRFCPMCNKLPGLVLGDMAMCVNDECTGLFWKWARTLDENLMDCAFLRFPESEPGE